MKRIFAAFALFALAAVGSAQTLAAPPPASSYKVTLTWTAPAGCTTAAPCTYAVYREVTASSAWTLIQTTASQTTTATDSAVSTGTSFDYQVETVQGGANSVPSNTVTMTIPFVPSAPSGLSGSVVP